MALPKIIQKLYENNFSIKVVSNSMFPKLKIGQKIKVIPNARIKFGDIVLWHSKGKIIAHRFYFKLKNHYITKGDNNRRFDLPWNQKHYIGKVQTKISLSEKINMFFGIFKAIPRSIKRLITKGFLLKRE